MLEKLRHSVISRIASRHVAGTELEDALTVCKWAISNGYHYILSPWKNGDITNLTEEEKSTNADSFIAAMMSIKKRQGQGYLSLKLDAIDYDYGLFSDLLEISKSAGIKIHIDSLAPDTCEMNFTFLERSADDHEYLGCTLPSRWQRSLEDAERAIDLGLAVRLVKGQWEDPYGPVNHRENYVKIAEKLAGSVPYIGVATHDKKLASQTLRLLKGHQSKFELEQFFSLPLNGIELAKEFSCPYRIYISYGYPAIPYNYRFAMTRPSLGAWMVSDFAFHFKKPWAKNGAS